MPNALVVVLCAVAAASFWTVLGFALARRLVGPALALPIAPALGWAVHSAAALPILLLAGFSTTTVAIVSAAALAAGLVALLTQRSRHDSPPGPSVPVWAYLGAAVLALAAAVAIMPKVGIDGVAFAPPIFDHSKVALIDEMTRLGLPPGNPFFGAVGEPASRLAYYYLWHFSAAELALLTGASGWEADIAMTWFTAFSSLALMLGLANWFSGRATALLWVLLLNAALSCRVVLAGLFGTEAVHQVLMPATGFGGWLFQAAWVPQHIAAASAVILALFFLGRLAVERSPLLLATLVLLAVAGYESSTWIGGVLFPVAAAMAGGMLLIEAAPRRRMSFLSWCAAAAILAICLAWPLLHDQFLATGMRAGGSPIAFRPFEVLGTAFPDGLRRTLDLPAYWLLLLPIEFPAVYVTGAVSLWAYLRRRNPVGGGDEQAASGKDLRAARGRQPCLRRAVRQHDRQQQRSGVARGPAGGHRADGVRRGRPVALDRRAAPGPPSPRRSRPGCWVCRMGWRSCARTPRAFSNRTAGCSHRRPRCGLRYAGTRRPMSVSPTIPCSCRT